MADGSVKIEVGLNIGKAEKDLAKLKEKINKAENELNSNSARKTELEKQIAQVGAQADEAKKKVIELKDQLNNTRSREEKASIRAQLAEATEEQRILTRESDRLNDEYVKVSSNLEKGKASITEMKEQAGEMARQIEASRPGEAIAKSLDNAKKSLTRFLKYAIGIRSVYILFQRLKGAIKSAVQEYAEYDKELKYNLALMSATRKAIQVTNGAALASAFNAILPIVQKIANWTLEAANNAAKFIAILSGKSSYKRVVVNTAEVAASLEDAEEDTEDTAEAADDVADGFKEVKRQVLGFDELNILDTDTDTDKNAKDSKDKIKEAEKAALDGIDVIDEAIDGLDNSFLDKLALTMKDVLFDWSDLNPEQIAEKIIAGLGVLLGAALGITLGMGPGGVLLMTLGGLLLGLVLDSLIFDHDGTLSGQEIADMISLALTALAGGAIGFVAGGPGGALIGATISVGIFAGLKALDLQAFEGQSNIVEQFATALTIMAGAAIGFVVGGPGGALIGATIGIGVSAIIEALKFSKLDNKERSKYRSGLDWFVVGVLGLPTDEQLKQWGINAVNWLGEGFFDLTEVLHEVIGGPIEKLIEEDIPETLKWLVKFITGFSTSDWRRAWQGARDIFKNIFSRLPDILKAPINGIIRLVNKAISGLNHLIDSANKIPGVSISHISEIPMLARGGILKRGQIGLLEGSGDEAVVPLERNTEWMNTVADALMERMTQMRFSNDLAAAFASTPRPAMAGGGIVPPNAIGGGGISQESMQQAIERGVYNAITALGGMPKSRGNMTLDVNGREFARAIYSDFQAVGNEHGISLIES